ncbi:MAG: GFA family protein [Thermoleophilaceae bacterium]
MDAPITGGCMCGAVRYEVSALPEHAGYCHCTRCQRRTGGAASISARLRRGSFTILEGAELVSVYMPDEGFEKAFCSRCGSALFSRNPADPEQIGVRMGTFDADSGVRPSYRQFVAYAAPWEPIPDDGLPRHPERRPS